MSPPRVVAHPTPEDRVARGRAARAARAAVEPRGVGAGSGPPGSGRPAARAGRRPGYRSWCRFATPACWRRRSRSTAARRRSWPTDLAATPTSGIKVQCCGDAHLANFGGFAAPDRTLVFDVNDFDETLPGPWEWDVKRLAASFDIAARAHEFDDKVRTRVVRETVRAYREAMQEYAGTRNLDLWYQRLDEATVFARWKDKVPPAAMKRYQKNVAKARTRDSLGAFNKLTGMVNGRVRILSNPPLVVPIDELFPERMVASEARDDAARVVPWLSTDAPARPAPDPRDVRAGGLRPQGRRGRQCRHPVAGSPCCSDATAVIRSSCRSRKQRRPCSSRTSGRPPYSHHGRRVVEGQRLMQSSSDIFLGWDRATDTRRRRA